MPPNAIKPMRTVTLPLEMDKLIGYGTKSLYLPLRVRGNVESSYTFPLLASFVLLRRFFRVPRAISYIHIDRLRRWFPPAKSQIVGHGRRGDAGSAEEAPLPFREFNCRNSDMNPAIDESAFRNKLSRIVSALDQHDAKDRYEVETEDNRISSPIPAALTVTSMHSKIIHWEEGDQGNSYN